MIKQVRIVGLILALLAFALMGLACATRPGETTDNTTGRNANTPTPLNEPALSELDREFLMDVARGGRMEVQLGNLAAEKAASSDVKQFGQRMVNDHSQANQEITMLASKRNLSLSQELKGEQQEMIDHLSKLSGSEFDKAYMSEMVKDHSKDVAEFERVASGSANPELKAWATKTLPILQEHLRLARETAGKVGAKPQS